MLCSNLCVAALTLAAAMFAPAAMAAPAEARDAWAHATAPAQRVAGGFVTLAGGDTADQLAEARCSCAERVELHTMRMDDGVMRMRKVEGIAVPAGKTVVLQLGGLHLMLIGLRASLIEGKPQTLELRFEKAGWQSLPLAIRPRVPAGHEGHEHVHPH